MLSQVPWDILVAALMCVAGILFIAFSFGMTLGERRVQAILEGRGNDGTDRSRDGRGAGERHRGRDKGARETRVSPAGPDDATRDATRAIEEAAARAIQDLEAKAEAAARLLDEAEDRIKQLKATVAALEREARQGGKLEAASSPVPPRAPIIAGAAQGQEACHADEGVIGIAVDVGEDATAGSAASTEPGAGAHPEASATPDAARAEVAGTGASQGATGAIGVSERHALVLHLADQGLTLPEIARRAGIGRGEAQLVLDLHGKECRSNPVEASGPGPLPGCGS
jgi:hypothetical protein